MQSTHFGLNSQKNISLPPLLCILGQKWQVFDIRQKIAKLSPKLKGPWKTLLEAQKTILQT